MSETSDEQRGPEIDLSEFEEKIDLDMPIDDAAAMKALRQRTSGATKFVAILAIAGAVAGAYLVYEWDASLAAAGEAMQEIAALDSESERITALRALLPEVSDPELRERVLKNLAHYGDNESLPAMIEALEVEGQVRRGAAWAIAHLGSPTADSAKDALMAVIDQDDPVAHNYVVWASAVLADDRAAEQIVDCFVAGQLQDMPDFSNTGAATLVNALGIERLSEESLMYHESEAVRLLTAHALAEAASPQTVEPLAGLLRGELARDSDERSTEVIRAAAAGLGRSGDPRAGRPLFALLEREPGFQTLVVEALRKSVAGPGLVTLLGQANTEANRTDLIRLIAETHDDQVADALAGELTSEDTAIRAIAANGLADLGDARAQATLIALASDDDYSDAALEALKLVASPEISDDLIRLKGELPGSRAALLRIMGMTGDQGIAPAITSELDGDDVRSASLAAADLDNDGAFRTLLARVELPRDAEMAATNAAERLVTNERLLSDRRAAIQAIGIFGRPEASEALMTIVENVRDDYELRSLAAQSLGMVANDEQIVQVLDKVDSGSLEETASRYYMQALWRQPRPSLNARLLSIMASDAASALRRSASIAVGYSGSTNADARLLQMLEQDGSRREAAFSITLGGSAEAAMRLKELLSESATLREILEERIQNRENDYFTMLTTNMLESGQIWRRLRVAEILAEGGDEERFTYAWSKIVGVLGTGWGGQAGASRRDVRAALWTGLHSGDETRVRLAARVLGDLSEMGLLLRARDEGGDVGEAAQVVLRGLNAG